MKRLRSARNSDNTPIVVTLLVAASQTIVIGDLLQLDGTSRKLELAVAASTTIVGIANEAITTSGTVTDADAISVTLVRGEVVRMDVYTGGSKTTFATTDQYTTAYDLHDETSVAPDDTTGGMCYVQGFDNTLHTVDVIFADANLANVG